MHRADSEQAFYQTAGPDSPLYALQCASGTVCYADLPPGYYDCWAPAGVATEHFRWAYLQVDAAHTVASSLTMITADLPAPPAAASAQTSPVGPGKATAGSIPMPGGGMAPADSRPIRLHIPDTSTYRTAILYSAAGPVTLYAVKVY